MTISNEDLRWGTGRVFASVAGGPIDDRQTNDLLPVGGIGTQIITSPGLPPTETDCEEVQEDLNACEVGLGECQEENEALSGENEELNDALDNIIDDLVPSGSVGVLVSNQCITTIGVETDGYDIGLIKYAQAGGAGNFIEVKSYSPALWASVYGIEPAGGPNFGINPPNCELQIVGNNGYLSGWQFNPSVRMDIAGLLVAGDTCTVEARWKKANPNQTADETPFTIFTYTATSPSTLSYVSNIGSYRAQDDRP